MSELSAYMLSTWNDAEDSWFKKTFDAAREREWHATGPARHAHFEGEAWTRYSVVNDEIQVERIPHEEVYWPDTVRNAKPRPSPVRAAVQLLLDSYVN